MTGPLFQWAGHLLYCSDLPTCDRRRIVCSIYLCEGEVSGHSAMALIEHHACRPDRMAAESMSGDTCVALLASGLQPKNDRELTERVLGLSVRSVCRGSKSNRLPVCSAAIVKMPHVIREASPYLHIDGYRGGRHWKIGTGAPAPTSRQSLQTPRQSVLLEQDCPQADTSGGGGT